MCQETVDRLRVENLLGTDPALPRHANTEFDVFDSRHAVRIGPDGNRDTALLRAAYGLPIEVETMGVGVDLEGDPHRRSLLHHRIDIQSVGIAREQEPACRVADDGQVWIVHRRQHPRRHLALAHVEPAVDRCDHEVETCEHRFIEIDPAVLKDVGLHTLEDPDAGDLRIRLVDLISLPGEIVCLEPPRIGGGLAVIGDADVLVAGRAAGLRKLQDRIGAVGILGVAVEEALDIGALEEPGRAWRAAASTSPLPSRSSGSI